MKRKPNKWTYVALKKSAMKKLRLDAVEEAIVQQVGNNVHISVNAFTQCNGKPTFELLDVPKTYTQNR